MKGDVRREVVVEAYNPQWPEHFQALKQRLLPVVADWVLAIEHVGSTSVPGLAAKPIIDVDLILPPDYPLPTLVQRLEMLGYQHMGTLGLAGRDAFREPPGEALPHNLYACRSDSLALRNHLLLRDHLRAQATVRDAYGKLKQELAQRHRHSIEDYIAGKTAFITAILHKQGLTESELAAITAVNQQKR